MADPFLFIIGSPWEDDDDDDDDLDDDAVHNG